MRDKVIPVRLMSGEPAFDLTIKASSVSSISRKVTAVIAENEYLRAAKRPDKNGGVTIALSGKYKEKDFLFTREEGTHRISETQLYIELKTDGHFEDEDPEEEHANFLAAFGIRAEEPLSGQHLHRVVHCPAALKSFLNKIPNPLEAIKEENPPDRTVLHAAARSGNVASLEVLLALYPTHEERLAAVEERDAEGQTLLHWAALSKNNVYVEENAACIKAILALYPTPEERFAAIQKKDNTGRGLLHWAAYAGDTVCLKAVLEEFSNDDERRLALTTRVINQPIQNQFLTDTALHWAAFSGDVECLEIVLAAYPDDDAQLEAVRKDNHVSSVLRMAFLGLGGCVSYILDHFSRDDPLAMLKERDVLGHTALHTGAISFSENGIAAVFEKFTDVDCFSLMKEKNRKGCTPLDMAVDRENVNTIQNMLKKFSTNEDFSLLEICSIRSYCKLIFSKDREVRKLVLQDFYKKMQHALKTAGRISMYSLPLSLLVGAVTIATLSGITPLALWKFGFLITLCQAIPLAGQIALLLGCAALAVSGLAYMGYRCKGYLFQFFSQNRQEKNDAVSPKDAAPPKPTAAV